MNDNEQQLQRILKVLDNEGILKNLILIGSWCLLFYKEIFDNFEPTIATTDADFYVPNSKAIKEETSLISSFKEINYDLISDTFSHKSTFISPDGFELEFLTKTNREGLLCIKLGKSNIYAESMPYVDIFTGNYIEIKCGDINLKIASPSSYVLQKLLINENRKEKKEKDLDSIRNVLIYIGASNKSIEELKTLYFSLPKKWRNKIDKTCQKQNINLYIKK